MSDIKVNIIRLLLGLITNNNQENRRVNHSHGVTRSRIVGSILGGVFLVALVLLVIACPSSIPVYEYVCENGTPVVPANAEDVTADNIARCARCNEGYKLQNEQCVAVNYTCENGTPVRPSAYNNTADADATSDSINKCERCNDGFKLQNEQCVDTEYLCANGTPTDGKPSGSVDVDSCKACNEGYIAQGTTACVRVGEYFCENGTPRQGSTGSAEAVHECVDCRDGYKILANKTCTLTAFTCNNGTPTTGSPSTGNQDVESCQSCSSGYVITSQNTCNHAYVCNNGTPSGDSDATADNITKCQSCNSNYIITSENTCNHRYVCSNGVASSETDASAADITRCISCNSNYIITAQNTCNHRYICNNGVASSETDASAANITRCLSCTTGYLLVSQMCAVDSDTDGVANTADSCPMGIDDWTSDTNTDADSDGCRDSALLSATEINDDSDLADSTTDAITLSNDDYFGTSVAFLGDLDGAGDGVVTIAVGAYEDDAGGASNSNRGAVHLLNLNSSLEVISATEINDSSTLVGGTDAIDLSNGDRFGVSVASLGDLDGLGIGAAVTLAVGAHRDDTITDTSDGDGLGTVYLFNLNSSLQIISVREINNTSNYLTLADGDQFGVSLASLGDLDGNGSGAVTLAVGANGTGLDDRGKVYLLNLNSNLFILNVTEIDGSSTLTGSTNAAITLSEGDYFGISLASLGDLDASGSGAATLAVGASRDNNGGSDRGAVHLLNLNSSRGIISATEINDSSTLVGGTDAIDLSNGDQFGASVASLGDLDGSGSGTLTLAVGAHRYSDLGTDRGAVHLLNLNSSFQIVGATEINDSSTLVGGTDAITLINYDYFGASLASLGDLDGDGSGVTFAVGANQDDAGGANSDLNRGAVHILNLDIIEDWD